MEKNFVSDSGMLRRTLCAAADADPGDASTSSGEHLPEAASNQANPASGVKGGRSGEGFICFFYRQDPRRYHRCLGFKTPRFSDLIQHLKRHHVLRRNRYCSKCYQGFKSTASRDRHHRSCHDLQPLDGIVEEEWDDLRKSIKGGKATLKAWFQPNRLPETNDLCELRWHLISQKYFGLVGENAFRVDTMAEISAFVLRNNEGSVGAAAASPASALADPALAASHTDTAPRYRRSQFSSTIGRIGPEAEADEASGLTAGDTATASHPQLPESALSIPSPESFGVPAANTSSTVPLLAMSPCQPGQNSTFLMGNEPGLDSGVQGFNNNLFHPNAEPHAEMMEVPVLETDPWAFFHAEPGTDGMEAMVLNNNFRFDLEEEIMHYTI